MIRPASDNLKTASKPALKSPLRTSTMPRLGSADSFSSDEAGVSGITEPPVGEVSAAQLRKVQISEFSAWLRAQTNKHRRPFPEETIRGYAETARALGLWMAEREIDGDFTACDGVVLNEFFAAYRNAHTQGGTNTRQRAEEAGYDPHAVHQHMFLHTFANDWLAGGRRVRGRPDAADGWQNRSMVDRYAADMQDQRAFEAKRRRLCSEGPA